MFFYGGYLGRDSTKEIEVLNSPWSGGASMLICLAARLCVVPVVARTNTVVRSRAGTTYIM
jgi:hypothetical protein